MRAVSEQDRHVRFGSLLCENADDTLSGATFESAVARF